MAKIIFLGTAASIPAKKRDNTSFLFIRKNETFLIDCPGSIVQKLIKVGIDFKKLKKIIITHQHPDHIYGIISLIHTQCRLNDCLTVFSNSPAIRIIKQLVKLFSLNKKPFPKIKYRPVFKSKVFYNKPGVKIRAVKNKHIKDSFGIKISFDKKTLFYSSDTAFSKDMLEKAAPFDYLIHDCTASASFFAKYPQLLKMHTSAKQLANYLKNKLFLKLIPVHFLLWEKNAEKRIKQELSPLKGRLIFVQDFQAVNL